MGLFSKRKRESSEGALDIPLPPVPSPPGFAPSANVAQDIRREIESVDNSSSSALDDIDIPELPEIPDLEEHVETPVPETQQNTIEPRFVPQKQEVQSAPEPALVVESQPEKKPVQKQEVPVEEDVSLPDFSSDDLESAEDAQSMEPLRIESALFVETEAYRSAMKTMRDLKPCIRTAADHADKISLVHDRESKALGAWRLGLERVQDALMRTDAKLFER